LPRHGEDPALEVSLLFTRKSTFFCIVVSYHAHGDVVQLTNATTGAVTKNYSYDAFGNEKTAITGVNPYRYCGEYNDLETGMYYLRARYYEPKLGRFTQQDTHWTAANMIYGDNPQKINERQDALGLKTYTCIPQLAAVMQAGNLYVYCVGNPIKYKDDTGEISLNVLIGAGIGAVVGAVGQFISDVITSKLAGDSSRVLLISNWQTYLGAALGGAIGGAVLGGTGNVTLSNAITGATTTGISQLLEKMTIENYSKSWEEIGANIVLDGLVSFSVGELISLKGVTAGRNSMSSVYRAGLTKIRNGTAERMSVSILKKGLFSNFTSGIPLDAYYGLKQYLYEFMKSYLENTF